MKSKIMMIMAVLSLGAFVFSGQVYAEEKGSMMEEKGSHHSGMKESGAVKVGNTICPLSKKKVGEMGPAVEVEYEGKIYNLCCKMCLKDFNKDPEKYIKMINEAMDENTEEDHGEHKH